MSEICRICLTGSVTLVGIFDKRERKLLEGKLEPTLADMIITCADCQINCQDSLPQQICLSCVLAAQNAFRFKRQCERSYQLLQNDRDKDKLKAINLDLEMPNVELDSKEIKSKMDSKVSDVKSVCKETTKLDPTEVDESRFKCNLCPRRYRHKQSLTFHQKKDHAIYFSNICKPNLSKNMTVDKGPKCLKTHRSLKVHTNKHADDKKDQHRPTGRKRNEPPPTHKCPKCLKLYSRFGCLKRHMRKHLNVEKDRPKINSPSVYKCPKCFKTYNRFGCLYDHLLKHND